MARAGKRSEMLVAEIDQVFLRSALLRVRAGSAVVS